jgi:dipeptidyl aminopeptidase/acylaminoacyl peptidase
MPTLVRLHRMTADDDGGVGLWQSARMGVDLEQLLSVTVFRALDIDPDRRILAGSDESGSMQLTEIAPDGSAVALTALPGACRGRYLPGARTVVVSHDDGGNERGQLSLLRLPRPDGKPAALADLEPLVHDPRFIHELADVSRERICYLTNRRDGIRFDAVLRDLASGAEETGYASEGSIGAAAVSPDGRWLVVTVPSAMANSDQLFLVDLSQPPGPARARALTGGTEHATIDRPQWLPGSDAFLVTTNRDQEFTGIARYDLASGQWSPVISDPAVDVTGWLSPDGTVILAERNEDGASVLALHDAATGALIRDLPLPAAGCITDVPLPDPHWAAGGGVVAMSITAAGLPGDVLLADPATATVRAMTSSARSLGGAELAQPAAHQIPAPDGELVPCLVYRSPAPADPALADSAVLVIHGGPESQAKRNYNPVVQALAAAGHTVLVPNVRGSAGYGKRWYSADDVTLRLDSVADLAAIHAYLPELGVDPARAALYGGSYGGYMVLAGLAFQPELWAAGVDIVGISSLLTFLENTSAYRRAQREREYGSLTRDRDFLIAASPLTRIDDIRAPLFIIHGANDPRVPLSEAEQLHAALTARGQECELLVYADEGHGLAKRANKLDAYPKAFAFLSRHLAS